MSILAKCPTCRRKQSLENDLCKKCGLDLVRAKRQQKVDYWIAYRIPGSRKLYRQKIGTSLKDARDADAKRRVQQAENRILDMLPESNITFSELAEWYTAQHKVKRLAMIDVLKVHLKAWNAEFGEIVVKAIKPMQIDDFQAKKLDEGMSASYIDQIIGSARTMVNKAFFNDMVSGDCLKPFKKAEKLLKRNSNARDRILTRDEYGTLVEHLPNHLKPVIAMGYWTGMRRAEILNLTWDQIRIKHRLIDLSPEDTKDEERRLVPIVAELYEHLRNIPRAIHDNHVFLYRGKPIKDLRTGLKAACTAAGIKYGRNVPGGFTFHDLRHTFNTNMRKAGVEDSVVMQITGHSTREMFDRYNTVDVDDAKIAGKKLLRFLERKDKDGKAEKTG